MEFTIKKDLVSLFLDRGVLLSPDKIKSLTDESAKEILGKLMEKEGGLIFLNEHYYYLMFPIQYLFYQLQMLMLQIIMMI